MNVSPVHRRNFKFGLAAWPAITLLLLACSKRPSAQQEIWNAYKERFVSVEGRVVDDANDNVSHSESQGYGLILAEADDDEETFNRIWKWTAENLRKRKDHLFAWRWKPSSHGGMVDDLNNATDGDILIAWGLCRAAAKWNNAKFKESAREIAQNVRQKLIRDSQFGPVLLPGAEGFEKTDGMIVNLSYWVFPAFQALQKIDPAPEWQSLQLSGLKLLETARFSSWELPPDWLLVTKSSVAVAPGQEAVYGYNAVRIPLYLAWAGIETAELYASFRRLNEAPALRPVPAKVFLPSGKFGDEPALPGMQIIYDLVAGNSNLRPALLRPLYEKILPGENYYSASLGLLSNCGAIEASKINR